MWTCPIITRFFFFFSISLVLLPTTHAVFNITKILRRYPQFDTYNENLSQTGLAKFVNGQKSATVLVIANDQLRSFAQMQQYEVKKILTFHLMFGYYDASRLKGFASRTTLPTFYQGAAALTSNYEGNGIVTFRSSGESTDSKGVQLLATIEAQQDISVLQIASIVPMIAPTPPRPQQLPPVASPPRKLLAPATAQAPTTQQTKSPPLAPPPSPTVTPPPSPSPPPPTPSTKTTPSTAPPPPQTPSTKTAPSTPSPPPPTPSSSNKTTPSNNAQSSPPPSPPSTPTPSANKTKPSTNAPPPSDATKPSVTAPSEAPAEANSTTPTPPAASPPTEAQAPDSSSDENNAPTPVVSPPKPSSETPAPATAADAPASASTPAPAPAPEKSAARERISSGNHLSSILVIFTAASFLFSVI